MAYQLDLATSQLGRWIETCLAERDRQGRPIHRLEDLLRDDVADQRFRSVKELAVKKMKIPESGVW